MKPPVLVLLSFLLASPFAHGKLLVTRDAATIASFQQGLAVLDFEGSAPLGRSPQAISNYALAVEVQPAAMLFDQASGVRFSVGGAVGRNMPAIYRLEGAIGGDAASGRNVLGPVDFDFNSNFQRGAFIEIFFPTKVSKVGFWLNLQLDFVTLIAANTNFAFSGEDEIALEDGIGSPGFFVGIERPNADIGGFKILARGNEGFSIDDFSYGATAPVPEPSAFALLLGGLAALRWAPAVRARRAAATPNRQA